MRETRNDPGPQDAVGGPPARYLGDVSTGHEMTRGAGKVANAVWRAIAVAVVAAVSFSVAGACSSAEDGAAPAGADSAGQSSGKAEDGATEGSSVPRQDDSTGSSGETGSSDGAGSAGSEAATGSLEEVEEPAPAAPIARPVGLDGVAEFGDGVTARLAGIEAVDVEAALPGEISGPAVRVTVELTNGSAEALSLDNVAVVVQDPAGVPVPSVASPDEKGFSGSLEAGASATGTYTFSLDPVDRGEARLTIKYAADAPTVVFTGRFPDA